MYNARDARDAYQKLYQLSPNLAEQSLSLIPSERMAPGIINLASNRLLATVLSLPQRKIEDAYAQAWFKFKDLIEVEYSTNYIKADFEIWTRQDNQGNYLVNYFLSRPNYQLNRMALITWSGLTLMGGFLMIRAKRSISSTGHYL